MKISKRDRRVLIIGGLGCAVLLLIIYGILPFFESRSEMEAKLEREQRRLEQSLQILQSESYYRTQTIELEETLERYRTQLLDAEDSTRARVQLQAIVRELAEESGVTISRSNPMQEQKVGEYAEIILQVNLEGGVQELTDFLYAISTHPKFLKIGQFRINVSRSRKPVRMQPQMRVSGFIRLSEA